jgi:hypothetical protein
MASDIELDATVHFWKGEIALYERTVDKWMRRGRKILKRYKDVRTPREDAVTRLNILWSNVQTRLPALYARDPIPEVERRFKDRDPIGRVVSDVLERCLDYTVQHCNPFGRLMRQAVLDYELAGRGTVWIRYVPHIEARTREAPESEPAGNPGGVEDPDEALSHNPSQEVAAQGVEITNDADDEADEEELTYEEALIDYVYWEDFGHTWARTWDEVRAVWRRVYLDGEELKERFGEKADNVPLDWSPKSINDSKIRLENKKAVVYEIWDKQEHKLIWITKNHPSALDEKDDPLELEHFFPCPAPLYSNLASDELIPTPNFVYYQDQANEIDELSTRIAAIGKALKVAGLYNKAAEGVDRLLAEGTENQLVPVDGWAVFKERGGLAGAIELLPLKDIAEALGNLREQRQQMIDDVYQITGLSDIIRGLSEPNETATAQQIKGQFAVLRISDAQTEVQRFCRDVIRILAEIISDYDIETIKKISGVKLLTNAEKAAINAQIAALQNRMPQMPPGPAGGGPQPPAGAPMQPPAGPAAGPPPGAGGGLQQPGAVPGAGQQMPGPDQIKLLKEPSWEEVAALLENPVLREFRIDVETDSTIRTDEDADKRSRMEFLTAASTFIQQAVMAPPMLAPAIGEMFLFGVRGFKTARSLERVFEDAMDNLKNAPPKPDPEQQKAQLEAQTQIQIEGMRGKTQIEIAQATQRAQAQEDAVRNQLEMQAKSQETQVKTAHEAQLEQLKQSHENERTTYETEAKKQIAGADNETKLQIAAMQHEHEAKLKAMEHGHEQQIAAMKQQHEAALTDRKGQMDLALVHQKGEKDKEAIHAKAAREDRQQAMRGQQEERMAHVKPAAEKKAEVDGEAAKHEATTRAIEALTEAMKEVRKPRRVLRDKDGRIAEIH